MRGKALARYHAAMTKNPIPFDESVYRSAKSTRPGWANALIVAGVIFLAAIAAVLMGGVNYVSSLLFLAAGVTAVLAGTIALAGVKRR